MILQGFKRLIKTDYAQQFQQLVDQLATSLNIGIETLYTALNNNVNFRDNIYCTVKDVVIGVDSSGNPTTPITFPITVSKVDGLLVISATNNTDSTTYPTGAVFVSWTQVQTGVMINNVTGLQAGTKYTLRIIALGQ